MQCCSQGLVDILHSLISDESREIVAIFSNIVKIKKSHSFVYILAILHCSIIDGLTSTIKFIRIQCITTVTRTYLH